MPESFLKKMLSIKPKPRIAVAGVGGCGCRAVQILASSWSWLHGVDFVNADTDFQELVRSPAGTHVWLGERLTRGLGADGSPELGRRAALESLGSIRDALQGADVVFVVCGMGGGTGTGAAPVVARTARSMGALALGLARMPFKNEHASRIACARKGIRKFGRHATLLFHPPSANDRLLALMEESPFLESVAAEVDRALFFGVKDWTGHDIRIAYLSRDDEGFLFDDRWLWQRWNRRRKGSSERRCQHPAGRHGHG